jgi:hypothetical protein
MGKFCLTRYFGGTPPAFIIFIVFVSNNGGTPPALMLPGLIKVKPRSGFINTNKEHAFQYQTAERFHQKGHLFILNLSIFVTQIAEIYGY